MKRLQKGFTLIELLVVIAIIGILSAVVLASLNSARNKGADAAIKSNINNARAQAELYYDGTGANSYDGACDSDEADGLSKMVTGVDGIFAGNTPYANCDDVDGAWAFESELKSKPGTYYCADSTGFAGENTTSKDGVSGVAGTATVCPTP